MMSAAHALIEMPTECGRTTARNGQQYLDVLPTNPLAISLDEGSSSSADEIGNLERRRGHWGTSSSNVTHTYIKAAGRSLLRSSCAASAAGRLRPNELTSKLILAGILPVSERKSGSPSWRGISETFRGDSTESLLMVRLPQ